VSPRDITGSLTKPKTERGNTKGARDIRSHMVSKEKLLVMIDEPGPCSTCPQPYLLAWSAPKAPRLPMAIVHSGISISLQGGWPMLGWSLCP